MKNFLERIDTFLGLFERYVKVMEEDLQRAKSRDEIMNIQLARQAEAVENMASTSHAQTAISKRTADALERSLPTRDETDG